MQTTDQSVSFLDLLTCGLGAMLLLFFVVASIIRDPSSTPGTSETEVVSTQKSSAGFVFHIASIHKADLFATDREKVSLTRNGNPIDSADRVNITSDRSSITIMSSTNFPAGTRMEITGLRSKVSASGFIVDRFGTQTVQWPLPSTNALVYEF